MSGLWTAAETGAMSLGPVLILALLAVSGFRSGGVSDQSAPARWAIVLGFSALPAVLAGASLLAVRALGTSYPRWTERT